MDIYAIAIYECFPGGAVNRLDFALKYSLFSDLKKLESQTLKNLPDNMNSRVLHIDAGDEQHYLKKEGTLLLTIISKKILLKEEAYRLFFNIRHVHQRGDKAAFKFKQILDNPLGYTRHDGAIMAVQDKIEEVRELCKTNISLAMEVKTQLEDTESKTIQLDEAAKKFAVDAKKMNKCCRYF